MRFSSKLDMEVIYLLVLSVVNTERTEDHRQFRLKMVKKLRTKLLTSIFFFLKNQISGTDSRKLSFKPEKQRSAVSRTPNRRKRNKKMPRLRAGLSSTSTKQQAGKSTVPPELLSRFPSALQEINRRIMGQNFLWLALQLD